MDLSHGLSYGAQQGAVRIPVPGPTQLTELASGIDALYLFGRGTVSPSLLEDLKVAKAQAMENGEPVRLDLGAAAVDVSAGGFGRYKYKLNTGNGLVGITDSKALPPIRIQPLAAFLHAIGPREAIDWFDTILRGITADLTWTASRVDVFSDWQGWLPSVEERSRFVCRANARTCYEDGEELRGLVFGNGKTKTVMARLYDKTAEVLGKGTDWWPSVWGERYDRVAPVLRIEFQVGRVGLKQYGINTDEDALRLAPGLWRAVTGDWLTHRMPTGDETRSRWPLSSVWEQVQNPTFADGSVGLQRVRDGQVAGSMRKLLPLLNGCVSSAAALMATSTMQETLDELVPFLRDYEIMSRKSFAERLAAKRCILGLS